MIKVAQMSGKSTGAKIFRVALRRVGYGFIRDASGKFGFRRGFRFETFSLSRAWSPSPLSSAGSCRPGELRKAAGEACA